MFRNGSIWTELHAYYHADGNGNVTALVNDRELIVARYSYDPYGNTLSLAGPLAEANSYRLSSKEIHRATGLYYYGYRFYSPNLQRWLNRDPLTDVGFAVERRIQFTIPRINPFLFCGEQPISRIDPLGLSFADTCKEIVRDIGKIIRDKIIGKGKKDAKNYFGKLLPGNNMDDAKMSCDNIKNTEPEDMQAGVWETECQACAAYKCALSAESAFAAEKCFKDKLLGCAAGQIP